MSLYNGETNPVALNPVLRGVDLALDRLVRRDCFSDRTLRILDELRAEIVGATTPNQMREHYASPETQLRVNQALADLNQAMTRYAVRQEVNVGHHEDR